MGKCSLSWDLAGERGKEGDGSHGSGFFAGNYSGSSLESGAWLGDCGGLSSRNGRRTRWLRGGERGGGDC